MQYARLTPKWKAFLILNYVMLIPMGLLILNHLPKFSKYIRSQEVIIYSVIMFIQMVGILFNNCMNIYIVNRFFPDTVLPIKIKRLMIVSLILDLAVVYTLVNLVIQVWDEEWDIYSGNGIIVLSGIVLILGLTIYFLILRSQINKYLNHANRMKKLIDHIGSDPPN